MEKQRLTLGSLFDGSGGFPLGGMLAGIEPIWASEIEPFPMMVTMHRLPFMKHYGDISQMDGAKIEPVDIITFGSPCQDMSVAGRRDGLDGERSSLFYEAIRIIKEMREKTNGKYPRYIVWENVPGAFSSNKGEDFRCVLECISKIKDQASAIPKPNGKWENAGCIMGEDFSIAWRVLDAQYWGVPQRRKRIFLVADFDGGSAGKVLFESEGVSGYSPQSFLSWQRATRGAEVGTGEASCYGIDGYNSAMSDKAATLGVNCGLSTGRNGVMCLNDQGGNRMDVTEDATCTLRAESHHPPLVFENHARDARYRGPDDVSQTILSTFGTGGNNQPFVVEDTKCFDVRFTSEGTRNARQNCYETTTARTIDTGGNTPDSNQGGVAVVAYGICSKSSNAMLSENPEAGFYEAKTTRCLDANGGNPSCNQGGMAIVSIEGNGSRPSHNGDGYSEGDVAYTLNATERHAVAFADVHAALSANDGPKGPSSQMLKNPEENFAGETVYGIDRAAFNQGRNALYNFAVEEELEPTIVARGPGAVMHKTYSTSKASYHTLAEEELANTLVASDYKDPPVVNAGETEYIVRRLTPTECARLQGFPDWWCDGLENEHPSSEDVYKWHKIFETHRKAIGKSSKPRTENQIRAFLKDPHSDAAEYKMWGNGVALPCVYFVLSGIAYYASECIEK